MEQILGEHVVLFAYVYRTLAVRYFTSRSLTLFSQNRDYVAGAISDLSDKLEQAESALNHSGRMGSYGGGSADKKKEESQLTKLTRDRYVPL